MFGVPSANPFFKGYYRKSKSKTPVLIKFKINELTLGQVLQDLNINTDIRTLMIENPLLFLQYGEDILSMFKILKSK